MQYGPRHPTPYTQNKIYIQELKLKCQYVTTVAVQNGKKKSAWAILKNISVCPNPTHDFWVWVGR
jgi:hypothetical protein